MKATIRQRLASRKRRVERRLERAVRPNFGGPWLKGSRIRYELGERVEAIAHGGIGAMHQLVRHTGLAKRIDERLKLLKVHWPYHESDHVLNIAYNLLCGGRVLEDIELRRNDEAYLNALGTESIPDPTTAGDFCRRFDEHDVHQLMDAINQTRLQVWRAQDPAFFEQTARIDADGTLVGTDGECKEGMALAYNGVWGYHPLVVSFPLTQEVLFAVNRSANRPSAEGAAPYFDKAITLCREAGFTDILLRGDTDFSQTTELDRWDADGVRFVFGYDARKNMLAHARSIRDRAYSELVRRAERVVKTKPRRRPPNIKQQVIEERGYKNIRLESEELVDFDYQPVACQRPYRVVALRKNLIVERGQAKLFVEDEVRYFFYITNDRSLSNEAVVREANQRCDQENLIAQLKSGVRALHAPVNTLIANWAYMVMASLAWSLKAWAALSLPVHPRWEKRHQQQRHQLLRMEFRTFLNAFINIPAQIVRTSRRIIYRLLAYNPSQHLLFRLLSGIGVPT
ncbi:MAG: IS1380 family transposase [bacterium]|nr:IS1380 family transposase [bacterium]